MSPQDVSATAQPQTVVWQDVKARRGFAARIGRRNTRNQAGADDKTNVQERKQSSGELDYMASMTSTHKEALAAHMARQGGGPSVGVDGKRAKPPSKFAWFLLHGLRRRP
jgi:hypothetical protein